MLSAIDTDFYTLRYEVGRGVALVLIPNADFRPATATSETRGTFKVEVRSRFFYWPVARKLYGSPLKLGRLLRLKDFDEGLTGAKLAIEVQAWAKRAIKALRHSAYVTFTE